MKPEHANVNPSAADSENKELSDEQLAGIAGGLGIEIEIEKTVMAPISSPVSVGLAHRPVVIAMPREATKG